MKDESAQPAVERASSPKPSRWGTILVVVGAFFIYAAVLFTVLAVVRSNLRLRVSTEQIVQVLIYAVIAFLCLRAGSRRRKGWGVLLGVCLLIFAGLAFASLSSLAAQRPGTLMPKVIAPTVIILAAAGIFSLVAALVRRSYNK